MNSGILVYVNAAPLILYFTTDYCECNRFLVFTDVNECDLRPKVHTCIRKISECINIPGSYSCRCLEGYEGDGQTCDDIDECSYTDMNTCDSVRQVKIMCDSVRQVKITCDIVRQVKITCDIVRQVNITCDSVRQGKITILFFTFLY